jgi:elongation factor Tu
VPVVRVSGLAALAGEERWVASVLDLLDAIDAYVPVPERYVDAPFLMAVENSLTITGRGTVVTGAIERGRVRVGEPVELIGLGAAVRSVVTSVETFGKTMEGAQAGDNAALLLRGVGRHQVRRGQVLAAPGSLRAHQRFTAVLHLLSAAEGGRHTPVRSGYSPQFYVRTTDVSGVLDFGGDAGAAGRAGGDAGAAGSAAVPGKTVQVTVALGKPVALDAGQTFAIREGGRTVGAGTVTALLD